jgi:hypothetical protein
MGSRTSLEKYLIGGVIVLALTAIGLLVGLIVVATSGGDEHNHDDEDYANLCLDSGCFETAEMLATNMNLTADP